LRSALTNWGNTQTQDVAQIDAAMTGEYLHGPMKKKCTKQPGAGGRSEAEGESSRTGPQGNGGFQQMMKGETVTDAGEESKK